MVTGAEMVENYSHCLIRKKTLRHSLSLDYAMFTVYVHFILVTHNHHSYRSQNGRKLPSLLYKERDIEALPVT